MKSTEQLIEEAKLRYPVGSNVKSLFGQSNGIIRDYFFKSSYNDIWVGTSNTDGTNSINLKVYDFSEKKWAEILSLQTNLTLNDYDIY